MAAYDVLVIGGGVNGSGVARDCAMRGMRTLLVDRHDICHGASGANTGMIHGGARYLLYDVATAKESCTDSGHVQRIAPHLLFRIPFIAPFFRSDSMAEIMLNGADMMFSAYDHYQPLKRGKRHVRLTRDETLALEPGLSPDIIGSVTMDEWGIDPFRLVIANATGCSSIYGGNLPTTPYAKNGCGRGPTWCNSLFEDNAEFGLGFRVSLDKQRELAAELLGKLAPMVGSSLAEEILLAEQAGRGGAPAGNAANGRKLFVSNGCYQCHGYVGQGGNAGAKLAPKPLPCTTTE